MYASVLIVDRGVCSFKNRLVPAFTAVLARLESELLVLFKWWQKLRIFIHFTFLVLEVMQEGEVLK